MAVPPSCMVLGLTNLLPYKEASSIPGTPPPVTEEVELKPGEGERGRREDETEARSVDMDAFVAVGAVSFFDTIGAGVELRSAATGTKCTGIKCTVASGSLWLAVLGVA